MPLRGCPELVCVVESSDSSTIIIIIIIIIIISEGGLDYGGRPLLFTGFTHSFMGGGEYYPPLPTGDLALLNSPIHTLLKSR